jgi:hypothetical protein
MVHASETRWMHSVSSPRLQSIHLFPPAVFNYVGLHNRCLHFPVFTNMSSLQCTCRLCRTNTILDTTNLYGYNVPPPTPTSSKTSCSSSPTISPGQMIKTVGATCATCANVIKTVSRKDIAPAHIQLYPPVNSTQLRSTQPQRHGTHPKVPLQPPRPHLLLHPRC